MHIGTFSSYIISPYICTDMRFAILFHRQPVVCQSLTYRRQMMSHRPDARHSGDRHRCHLTNLNHLGFAHIGCRCQRKVVLFFFHKILTNILNKKPFSSQPNRQRLYLSFCPYIGTTGPSLSCISSPPIDTNEVTLPRINLTLSTLPKSTKTHYLKA